MIFDILIAIVGFIYDLIISTFRTIFIDFLLHFFLYYSGKFVLIFFPKTKVKEEINKKVIRDEKKFQLNYSENDIKYLTVNTVIFIGLIFWIFLITVLLIII